MKHLLLILILIIYPAAAHALVPQVVTSPKGIPVWFVHDATTPTTTLSFAFRGGSEQDPAEKQGRAFLMAAALTEGTQDMPADVFQQLLADKNISLGFSAGREALTGSLRFLNRYHDTALELVREAIYRPAFHSNDVGRLQAQMLASLKRQESDADFRAARLMMQQTFGGTAYANAPRGTPKTIPALTPDDLRGLHRQAFTRANILVVVVGDTTASGAGKLADAVFGDLRAGTDGATQKVDRRNVGQTWFTPWMDSEQNTIMFSAPGLAMRDADYPAALILNDLVGAGGFRAMLMEQLRKGLGATYGISASLQHLDGANFTMGSTSVQPPMTREAMQLIRDSWGSVRALPFSDSQVAVSKNYLQSAFSRDLISSQAVASYLLGLRIARLPANYADTLPKQLESVTRDDLSRVAARLYDPTQLSFVVAGPKKVEPADRTINNIWTVQ